jgi:hypothetical protein
MIASLPFGVFLVMIAFLLAMAGIMVFAGLHARKRSALVSDTPTTSISQATDGYREFEGFVEAVPGTSVVAPLTRWPCCWYQARVEEWESRAGETSGGWKTVKEWTSGAPFVVRDTSGVCIVDPHLAEVTPTDKSRWHGDTLMPEDRNPARVGPTESAAGIVDFAGTAKFRYYEERIYAGDPLLVLGEFSSRRSGFDHDDEDEWESEESAGAGAAGSPGGGDAIGRMSEAVRELEADDARFDEARKVTDFTIRRGSGAKPFIITTTRQSDHVSLSAAGGAAAFGVALLPLAIAALLVWLRFG